MDPTAKNSLRSVADAALQAKDGEAAAKLYDQLVEEIKLVVGDGQKEIAAELQRLAKEMESEGKVEQAFDFKQQTCAVLLKLSMAARGRPGSPLPGAASPAPASRPTAVPAGAFKLECLLLASSDYEHELQFYTETMKAAVVWSSHEPRATGLSAGPGPLIVLTEHKSSGWQPVYSVADFKDASGKLEAAGWKQEAEHLVTPAGPACLFRSPGGAGMAILLPAHYR